MYVFWTVENHGRVNLHLLFQHKFKTKPIKVTEFSYKDCGGGNALINIQSVSVTPDPLVFPGPLNVATNFRINNNVGPPLVVSSNLINCPNSYLYLPRACHYR